MNDDYSSFYIKLHTECDTLEWGCFYIGVSYYNNALFNLDPWEAIIQYKKLGVELMLKDHKEYVEEFIAMANVIEVH